jgi:ornithine cyclodeaminase/alanine dehydrogenase-like protein (mu-crystallin family)
MGLGEFAFEEDRDGVDAVVAERGEVRSKRYGTRLRPPLMRDGAYEYLHSEIGQVLAGDVVGRRTPDEVTAYKSLGHVVQDLASAWALYAKSDSPS